MPATRSASVYYQKKSKGKQDNELALPEEYTKFLDLFKEEGTVLVAFGTTWMPKPAGIRVILDGIR